MAWRVTKAFAIMLRISERRHGRGSATDFGHALLEMHLNGKLRPKPTSRLFLQDAVSGGRALMERPAALRATWARGRLRVAYRGPCYCSKDVVPHCVEINQCVGCTHEVISRQ